MSILYVSPDGEGTNDGSQESPKPLVSETLALLGPGDVCQLLPGNYAVNTNMDALPAQQTPLVVPAGVEVAGSGRGVSRVWQSPLHILMAMTPEQIAALDEATRGYMNHERGFLFHLNDGAVVRDMDICANQLFLPANGTYAHNVRFERLNAHGLCDCFYHWTGSYSVVDSFVRASWALAALLGLRNEMLNIDFDTHCRFLRTTLHAEASPEFIASGGATTVRRTCLQVALDYATADVDRCRLIVSGVGQDTQVVVAAQAWMDPLQWGQMAMLGATKVGGRLNIRRSVVEMTPGPTGLGAYLYAASDGLITVDSKTRFVGDGQAGCYGPVVVAPGYDRLTAEARVEAMGMPVRRGSERRLPVDGETIGDGEAWTSEPIDLRPYAGGLLEVAATVAADQALGASVETLGSGDGVLFETSGVELGALPADAGAQRCQFPVIPSRPWIKVRVHNPGLADLTAVAVRWWPVLEGD